MSFVLPTDFSAGHLMTDSDMRQYRTALSYLHTWASWTSLSFSGSWANYGSSFGNGGYRLDPTDNIVHLRGLLENTANVNGSGNPIATLPSGYRPTSAGIFAASAGIIGTTELPITVRVTSAGSLYVATGTAVTAKASGGYVSLDGVKFALDQ